MSFLKDKEIDHLENIANILVRDGKGILAVDESPDQIETLFSDINIDNTKENRRQYRELILTTENMEKYISGVILHKETFNQSTSDGIKFTEVLKNKDIKIGITLDQGPVRYNNVYGCEFITDGLATLSSRASLFKSGGAFFSKWRCVYSIKISIDEAVDDDRGFLIPSEDVIVENAKTLAEFALICQINGLVPILEPEVLYDGDHDLDTCQLVTKRIISEVIYQLQLKDVYLPAVIISPNMVLPGKDYDSSDNLFILEDIAHATIDTLVDTIPISIPGIAFVSGDQSSSDAIERLGEINTTFNYTPWALTYSFGRALQRDLLKIWKGYKNNIHLAQQKLYNAAEQSSHSSVPNYQSDVKQ